MNSKQNPISKYYKIRVGITLGDPSGIGPAIILKALAKLKGLAEFVVVGDEWVFNRCSVFGVRCSGVKFIDLNNVRHKNFRFGKVRAEYGRASIEYLDKAVELVKNKDIDCLVTCPVSKEAINLAGIPHLCTGVGFSGHTEYLAKKTGTTNFVMMLLNEQLKISLVTRHIPLNKVSQALSRDKLYKTIFITHAALKNFFSIKNPRLVICGLNPHASDNGLIGNEENEIIKPLIKKLKNKFSVDGPLSADIAIYKTSKKQYDGVIAMYHDQALIPLKLSGQETGVNLTLGLPFVRTSPLHGTAFDVAQDYALAKPHSLIAAIKLAVRCTQNLKKV